MSSDDKKLLAAYVQHKDAEAFAALVERYESLVYTTSLRQLRNRADAEDISQEVFLSLARNAHQIVTGNLGGWLYRSALNAAKSKLRSDCARTERERARPAADRQLDSAMEWRQIEELLDACLSEMAAESRELLIQRYFVNRSQRELAEAFDVDQATISRRLKKAVDQLRRRIGDRGVTLSSGAIAAALAEHASGAAVPGNLSAGLTKIGIAGVGRKASSSMPISLVSLPWLILCVAGCAIVTAVAILIAASVGGGNLRGPTATVATLSQPLPFRVLAELMPLNASQNYLSIEFLAINNQGQVAVFNDVPQQRAGVYLISNNRLQRLYGLREHRRRGLAIGPGSIVVVRFDALIGVVDRDGLHPLTEAAVIDAPMSVNHQGWVVFIEAAPTSRIRLAAGDGVHTLQEAGGRFARFDDVSVNDDGQVAFRATRADGKEGLFVTHLGEVTTIAETGESIQEILPWLDFNDRGQVAFMAKLAGGNEAIFLGDGDELTKVAETGDYFASIGQVSLNSTGTIAFTARTPGEPADTPLMGLYWWDGRQVIEIVAQRQKIGGRTLDGVILCRDSLNDAGQIAALADFGPDEDNAIMRFETRGAQVAK